MNKKVNVAGSKKVVKPKKPPITKIKDEDLNLEKSFWTVDGKVLRNLKQAAEYLDRITKTAYAHHVNNQKNDFANWIGNTYNKKEIAEEIKKTKTAKEITNIIRKMI